jgi:hypothetical protein
VLKVFATFAACSRNARRVRGVADPADLLATHHRRLSILYGNRSKRRLIANPYCPTVTFISV